MTAPYRKRTPARGAASTLALAIALAGGTALAQGEGAGATTVKIAAQPLDQALTELGAQAGVQIVVVSEDAAGLRARPIEGRFTGEEAVDLLLKDSGLIQRRINDRTIVIGSPERLAADAQASWLRFAQVDTSARGAAEPGTVGDDVDDDDETAYETIETIVVTGTNIRGVGTSASPVLRFDREVIEQSGAATVADFIQRTLTQNFAAGASEQTLGTGRAGAELNQGSGVGVNIRGLGTDSTLVLINGKRIASSGVGSFVDVSMLPVSAIERVEILTDGASAIYGSDAVGGVVNFILRDDYEGAETRLRYGTVTEGDLSEYQVGQSLGGNWGSGRALLSYEFYNRGALDSEDRELTQVAFDPIDVLPEQTRNSVFFSGAQELGTKVEAYGAALYSNRKVERNASLPFPGGEEFRDEDVEQVNVTIGSRINIGNAWQADLSGTYSHADTVADTISLNDVAAGPFITNANRLESWVADAKTDGPFASLPGGEARLAFGVQYRTEDRNLALLAPSFGVEITTTSDRNAYALFGEAFLPLVGSSNARAGIERLELTVASRFEDYSDFGNSTDPKVGLLYSPVEGLNLRGTWGTSFRAPLLNELDPFNVDILVSDVTDPTEPSGSSVAAIVSGNNPNLTPEDAETWTAGFDFTPPDVPGLELGMTYFNIEFNDRILAPTFAQQVGALTDPSLSSLVNRNFSQAFLDEQIALAMAGGGVFDASAGQMGASSADVIINARLQNLASTNVSGFDFNVSYNLISDIGELGFVFNGTYLLEFDEQFVEAAPVADALAQVYQPPELRFRTGITWLYGGVGANAFVNHVGSLTEPRITPAAKVDSFTTVDFQFNAQLGEITSAKFFESTSAYVSIVNAFDEQPPFVQGGFFNLNFDGENHDILGRFIAFGLTHKW